MGGSLLNITKSGYKKVEFYIVTLLTYKFKIITMKKVYLLTLVSVTLFSCSKYNEQIDKAKSEIEKNVSDIEKKDIKYTCTEISDREAYTEIYKFHGKKHKSAMDNYYEFTDSAYLNEATKYQDLQIEDQNKIAKSKGEKIYYKITGIKTIPDTIIHTKVYLDNNNKIISTQYLK